MSENRTPIAEHVQALPPSGIREFFELVQGQRDVISLGVGEPDFAAPWNVREAAIYSLERGRTGYTSNLGLAKLREAIAGYVRDHFAVEYDPGSEILVTVGVSEALDLALRALVNPGDEVIYHEPCYVSYSPSIALAHGRAVPVACTADTGFSVTKAAIEAVITPKSRVLILNFPTNPTGGTMTRENLQGIAELAQRYDLTIIADEIYAELTFEGEHTSIAALPGMKERTVFLHGFSKAYAMTGFRVGYACGPAEIIRALTRVHQYSMLCASIISQEAALEAIRNGREAMANMREAYRQRRNLMVSALNDMGLACHLPRGSFYTFPSIANLGLTSNEFARRLLQEEKVACVPGDAFGVSGEGHLRCCFATALDAVETAMERMARCVQKIKG
ncbi:MAG: aromatic amino acid aminotransferase [Verrucomicrobiales bacterium]|nr:aromatic amino acid aminotransferase [Verrucomicrobiales bacterium]|tara:strand:- start:29147 stop:30319 length:1173 start_codon:yes stop_codon:yes gene_type:complete